MFGVCHIMVMWWPVRDGGESPLRNVQGTEQWEVFVVVAMVARKFLRKTQSNS